MPLQQTTTRSVSILLDMIEAETEQLRSLLPHASPSLRAVVNETIRIHQGNFDLSKIESVQLDDKLRTHWTIWASNHVEQLRSLKDAILKEHTNNSNKLEAKLGSEEDKMEKDVWK